MFTDVSPIFVYCSSIFIDVPKFSIGFRRFLINSHRFTSMFIIFHHFRQDHGILGSSCFLILSICSEMIENGRKITDSTAPSTHNKIDPADTESQWFPDTDISDFVTIFGNVRSPIFRVFGDSSREIDPRTYIDRFFSISAFRLLSMSQIRWLRSHFMIIFRSPKLVVRYLICEISDRNGSY